VVIFSIGEALWSSRFLEYVSQLAPPEKVGVYMGLANVPWFLAKFTTGLYSGAMIARFIPREGPQDTGTLWLVYTAIALSSPVGLLLARGWLRRTEPAPR
jgi:dipeptide/tripeptide permease